MHVEIRRTAAAAAARLTACFATAIGLFYFRSPGLVLLLPSSVCSAAAGMEKSEKLSTFTKNLRHAIATRMAHSSTTHNKHKTRGGEPDSFLSNHCELGAEAVFV